jgi:hypothetical protein
MARPLHKVRTMPKIGYSYKYYKSALKLQKMSGQGMTEEGYALQECKQSILVRSFGQNGAWLKPGANGTKIRKRGMYVSGQRYIELIN